MGICKIGHMSNKTKGLIPEISIWSRGKLKILLYIYLLNHHLKEFNNSLNIHTKNKREKNWIQKNYVRKSMKYADL